MPFFRSFAKLVTHRREKNPIMINYYGETFASTAMDDCRDDGEGYDFPRDYDCDCEDHIRDDCPTSPFVADGMEPEVEFLRGQFLFDIPEEQDFDEDNDEREQRDDIEHVDHSLSKNGGKTTKSPEVDFNGINEKCLKQSIDDVLGAAKPPISPPENSSPSMSVLTEPPFAEGQQFNVDDNNWAGSDSHQEEPNALLSWCLTFDGWKESVQATFSSHLNSDGIETSNSIEEKGTLEIMIKSEASRIDVEEAAGKESPLTRYPYSPSVHKVDLQSVTKPTNLSAIRKKVKDETKSREVFIRTASLSPTSRSPSGSRCVWDGSE